MDKINKKKMLLELPPDYAQWLGGLKQRIRGANNEQYWQLMMNKYAFTTKLGKKFLADKTRRNGAQKLSIAFLPIFATHFPT